MSKLIFHLFFLAFFNFSITEANNNLEYLRHTCSVNTTFPPSRAFKSNLHTLLTSLSSHAATAEYHNTTAAGGDAGETIYGMFMCRGDINNQTCQKCTEIATQQIASRCPNSKEAIIWYHECFVRYSNRSFFSTVDEWPRIKYISYHDTANLTKEGSYGWLLASTLNDAVAKAANAGPVGAKKFATKHASLGGSRNVYSLVQCTPDLSSQNCSRCLNDIMRDIPLCCLGTDGGMVLYPSCALMFGLHQFYSDATLAINWHPLPTSSATDESAPSGEERARSRKIIIASIPVVAFLVLFIAYRFQRIKALRRYKAILKENFGNESTSLESLQFDLATIEKATDKFSCANMIGKGGFGEVYKGILPDGREVAVKRLSTSSGQDPQKKRLLIWHERYKIIGGIARAILYLHEYSRLKIIHRDIKPSNILLDFNMNPKISDFGMARMVAIDQDQGRTQRIVGTYGYMSPEYAMLGKFSEKSDVFSFGVMVLEIISGKKNSSSYESYYADGLLSYAWKQWRDGTPFQILDTNLHESCSQVEVIRCIQVGLLCVQENPDDRPQMTEIVSYLSNLSIELPFPHEPAFFIHGIIDPNIVAMKIDLGDVNNCSTPYSINEMSITKSFPR